MMTDREPFISLLVYYVICELHRKSSHDASINYRHPVATHSVLYSVLGSAWMAPQRPTNHSAHYAARAERCDGDGIQIGYSCCCRRKKNLLCWSKGGEVSWLYCVRIDWVIHSLQNCCPFLRLAQPLPCRGPCLSNKLSSDFIHGLVVLSVQRLSRDHKHIAFEHDRICAPNLWDRDELYRFAHVFWCSRKCRMKMRQAPRITNCMNQPTRREAMVISSSCVPLMT